MSRAGSVVDRDGLELSLLQLSNPAVLAEPAAFYRSLREYEPVHWDPYTHAWVITGYSDVTTVLTAYSADRAPAADYLDRRGLSFFKPFADMMRKQMLFMDSPAHGCLRSICAAAFAPRKVEELRKFIDSTANELIYKSVSSGRIDLIADFANPLPAIITAKLLGVPVEDHLRLSSWVIDLAEVLGNFQHHPSRVSEILKSLEELKTYVALQIEEKSKRPDYGLICSLMSAAVDGQRLTREELIANIIITMIGGHETTTNLIASGFLTLLRNPESFEQLRDNQSIVNLAVEELLRFESPVQHTARIAPEDLKLGGKLIKKGSRVVAALAAANRDPSRFLEPDRLNLLRPDNRHLAFGWAAHFCFGAALARLEAQIAFNVVLRRLQQPVLLDNVLRWRNNAGLRGLTALNVSFQSS